MAITASIALASATGTTPVAKTTATVTVSNSGGVAVNVTGIDTTIASPHSSTQRAVAAICGLPPISPGNTVSVAASGSTTFSWPVAVFAPWIGQETVGPNPTSYVYDVSCVVYTSDGSLTIPSAATYTITAATH